MAVPCYLVYEVMENHFEIIYWLLKKACLKSQYSSLKISLKLKPGSSSSWCIQHKTDSSFNLYSVLHPVLLNGKILKNQACIWFILHPTQCHVLYKCSTNVYGVTIIRHMALFKAIKWASLSQLQRLCDCYSLCLWYSFPNSSRARSLSSCEWSLYITESSWSQSESSVCSLSPWSSCHLWGHLHSTRPYQKWS